MRAPTRRTRPRTPLAAPLLDEDEEDDDDAADGEPGRLACSRVGFN